MVKRGVVIMIALIDYENVGSNGLKGVENISSKDKIIIFYKENSTLTMSAHKKLECSKAEKEYICVKKNTKNALDFQLVAYLGLLCYKEPDKEYAIISNDGGFDSAIEFLKAFKIGRYSNLGLSKQGVKNATANEVSNLAPEYSAKANEIANVIDSYKTKQAINNNLMKILKSEDVGKLLKKIKPLLVGKN